MSESLFVLQYMELSLLQKSIPKSYIMIIVIKFCVYEWHFAISVGNKK